METVVLASFVAGGSTTLWSAEGSRWGASGSLVDGDVSLDEATSLVRVMVPRGDGSLLRLNDAGGVRLRDFFGTAGDGADLTVWVQTAARTVSFPASGVRTVGSNYVNFEVPASARSTVGGISSGDRFVLALTRPAPEPEPPPTTTTAPPPTTTTAPPPTTTTAPTAEPGTDAVLSRSEQAGGDLPASIDTTGVVAVGQPARGTIWSDEAYSYDADWFAADLTAGHAYQIQILGALGTDCTLLAPLIGSVRDASGRAVAGTEWFTENRGPWYRLSFTPESDGRHYIAVLGEAHDAGVGTYIVALTSGAAGHAGRIATIGAQGCVPEPPTALILSEASAGSVTLSWTAPEHSGISGYRILRGADTASLSVMVEDTGATATSYVDTGVSASTSYAYAVAALSPAGAGAASTAASATTPAPSTDAVELGKAGKPGDTRARNTGTVPGSTGLTLTPSFDRVTLEWSTPSGAAVTGYRIWRGADAANLSVLVSDTASAAATYIDYSVEAATTYHYAVAALNANGAGPKSTASIATLSAPQVVDVVPLVSAEQTVAAQRRSFSNKPIVTFASNLDQTASSGNSISSGQTFEHSFTTGPGDSGFLLDSLSYNLRNANDTAIVSLWSDDSDSPGDKLATLGRIPTRTTAAVVALDYLDTFLFPNTKYWIRIEISDIEHAAGGIAKLTTLRQTVSAAMDMGSMSGWTFHGNTKFELKGRVVPLRRASDPTPPTETLVSNLDNSPASGIASVAGDDAHAQRFRTGSNLVGYTLESVSFMSLLASGSSGLVVTVHESSNGVPAEAALFTLTGAPITGSTSTEYTYTAPAGARLEPDTNYWLRFTTTAGTLGFPHTTDRNIERLDFGWHIAANRYWRDSPTSNWFCPRIAHC